MTNYRRNNLNFSTSLIYKNILLNRKIKMELSEKDILNTAVPDKFSLSMLSDQEQDDFWEIVILASQLDDEVLHSINSLEFLHLAKYVFNLCFVSSLSFGCKIRLLSTSIICE